MYGGLFDVALLGYELVPCYKQRIYIGLGGGTLFR